MIPINVIDLAIEKYVYYAGKMEQDEVDIGIFIELGNLIKDLTATKVECEVKKNRIEIEQNRNMFDDDIRYREFCLEEEKEKNRIEIERNRNMFNDDIRYKEFCLEEEKEKNKLKQISIIVGVSIGSAILMQIINDGGMTLVSKSVCDVVKDGFSWAKRLI